MRGGWARFEGGSWGGKEYHMSEIRPTWRVPGLATTLLRGVVSEAGSLPPPRPWPTDEYMMYRRAGDGTYIYRWVRPDIEGMREKIACLTAELEACQAPPPRQGLMRFSR